MSAASQSLLGRITEAIRGCGYRYDHDLALLSEAVLVVVGERDAELRQHLATALSRSGTCIYGDVHPHIEAALALLGPTDTQDTP